MLDSESINARLKTITNRRPKDKWIRFAVLAGTLILSPLAIAGVKNVDTAWFPVVEKATLVVLSGPEEPKTRIRLILTKARNCRYLAADFFLRKPARTEISYTATSKLTYFPVGRVVGGELILDVNRDEFIESGEILISHQCHPLWVHTAKVHGE